MILYLYLARRFCLSLAVITLVLLSVMAMVELFDQTRKLNEFGVGFGRRIELVFLNLPQALNELLPLIVLLSTIALFVGLARSSELVVTRAVGVSALRVTFAPLVIALLIGAFATTMLGPIVAATSKRHATLSESYRSDGTSSLLFSEDGFWLRQGGAQGQSVIHASRSNADASILYDVTFVTYSADGGPYRRIQAETAAIEEGAWRLQNVKIWPLDSGLNPEANAAEHELLMVPSTLTLDRVRETLGAATGVSIWDMPEFIRQLEQAGFSSRRHIVWFQTELARPLFLIGMVLIAASFTMRHTRFGGTGPAVLFTVLMGFGLYFIRSFAQVLGENGQLPVMIAAWAPPLAAVLLALGLLLQVEDG